MKSYVSLVFAMAFLFTISRARITLIGSYSDDFVEDDFPPASDPDCVDSEACGRSSLYAAAEKRMIMPEKVVEHRQLVPRVINSADPFAHWKPVCGCKPVYEYINFGEGHYPRGISVARCNTCSNKFYQCINHEYRVTVLVKRGLVIKRDEELGIRDVEKLSLPESLANWQLFAFSVPVACIAVEKS